MQKEAEQVRYYHTKQKLKNYQDNKKKNLPMLIKVSIHKDMTYKHTSIQHTQRCNAYNMYQMP